MILNSVPWMSPLYCFLKVLAHREQGDAEKQREYAKQFFSVHTERDAYIRKFTQLIKFRALNVRP